MLGGAFAVGAMLQAMETDLYLTLGVDDDANEAEIKDAFGKLQRLMEEDENLKQDDDAIREVCTEA